MHRRDFSKGALAAIAAAAIPLARAETWPSRPIKMFISQPAGAGPDSVARMIAEQLSQKWGQAIVIENSSPEEMTAFMRKEYERWTILARLAGIQPE